MGLNTGGGGPHHATHENGGTDEVDATGLTGVGGGGGGSSPLAQTHVYRTGSQSITTGVLTAVSFQAEVRDDDGNWAVSPNPTRVIISQDDTYDIVAGVEWDTNVAGTFRKAGLYKNGVLLHEYSMSPHSFAEQYVVDYGVALVNGDYLEVKVTQDSGSSSTLLVGSTVTFLTVSRGGDPSFLPIDVFKTLRGDSPYGFRQHIVDGSNTDSSVSIPGDGSVNIRGVDSTGASGEIDVGSTIFLFNDSEIYLEPGTVLVVDTGNGIVFPYLNSDPGSPYDQSQVYYNNPRSRFRVNRHADNFTDVWQDLIAQGNAPFAFPVGWVPGGTYTTAVTLPANGGAIAVPILVPAPMVVKSIQFWNTDTTGDREIEANLYLDNWASATGLQVQGGSGGDADTFGNWTSSGAAIQGADYSSFSPIWLQPGIIWAVIRNNHATNTLGVGTLASSGTFSALNGHQTQTLGSFLDTDLDLVTGWTKATAVPGIVLRGRVLNQSGAW